MTPAETLDVVDEHDRVIGQRSRAEIHRAGLRHRSVHVLVHGATSDEVFLQRRAGSKECAPGLWDTSCAGHVEAGEGYAPAALRELAEELSVVPDVLIERFRIVATPATGFEHVAVFSCRWVGPIVMDTREISAGGWFSAVAIDAWMAHSPAAFTDTVRIIWTRWRTGNPAR